MLAKHIDILPGKNYTLLTTSHPLNPLSSGVMISFEYFRAKGESLFFIRMQGGTFDNSIFYLFSMTAFTAVRYYETLSNDNRRSMGI